MIGCQMGNKKSVILDKRKITICMTKKNYVQTQYVGKILNSYMYTSMDVYQITVSETTSHLKKNC